MGNPVVGGGYNKMASTAQFSFTSLSSCHSAALGTRGYNTHAVVSFPSPIRCSIGNNSLRGLQLPIAVVDSGRCAGRGRGRGHGYGGGGGGGNENWCQIGNFEDFSSSSQGERFVSGALVPILNGFISGLAADPQFPFKVLMEDDMTSRPDFGLSELDFFFSSLLVGATLNFTLLHLLAPTVESSSSIFANCTMSHLFEPGIRKSVGIDFYKKTVSTAGTALSKGLMKMWKKPRPTLLNAVRMGFSSKFRCQTLDGVKCLMKSFLPNFAFKPSVLELNNIQDFVLSTTGGHGGGGGGAGSGGGGGAIECGGGGSGLGRGGGGIGRGGGGGNWSHNDNFEDSSSFSLGLGFFGLFMRGWSSRVVATDPEFSFKVLLKGLEVVLGEIASSRRNFGMNVLGFVVLSILLVASTLNSTMTVSSCCSLLATMAKPGAHGIQERFGNVVYRASFVAAVWFAGQIALSHGLINHIDVPRWVEVNFVSLCCLLLWLFAAIFCYF